MSVELYPMQADDLFWIDLRDEYRDKVTEILEANPHVFEGPYSHTLWHSSGVPLSAAGIMHNGESWALMSRDMKGYGLKFSAYVRSHGLEPWVRDTGTPVIAHVDNDFPEAIRWVRLLGFRPEYDFGDKTKWVFYADAE